MNISSARESQIILHSSTFRPNQNAEKTVIDSGFISRSESDGHTKSAKWETPSFLDAFLFRWDQRQEKVSERNDLLSFRRVLEDVPSGDWYARFSSANYRERVQAYRENEHSQAGETVILSWWPLDVCAVTTKSPLSITKLHMVLTHLFGNLPYEDMVLEISRREVCLSTERVQRQYVARILRDNYIGQRFSSGSSHHRQEMNIRDMVEDVREMYQNIGKCLEQPCVRTRLQLVNHASFEPYLPKKAPDPACLAKREIPGFIWPGLQLAKASLVMPGAWPVNETRPRDNDSASWEVFGKHARNFFK